MLVQIPLLSFLLFGVTYPLCFWLSAKDPIKNNFHRFHLGCPLIVGGLAVIGICLLPLAQPLKSFALAWLAAFFLVTALFWNRDGVHLGAVTLLSLWGIKLFESLYHQWIGPSSLEVVICLLSGLIVSATFYAMNLGHFYLNVHGLKIHHLKNATIAYAVLLAIRLVWNIIYIAQGKVLYGGEEIALIQFLNSLDGILLWVAIFFGTVFPLAASYFAFGTLKLKNTQATTGILYVLLSAVLLGDLAYKYFLLHFHIPL